MHKRLEVRNAEFIELYAKNARPERGQEPPDASKRDLRPPKVSLLANAFSKKRIFAFFKKMRHAESIVNNSTNGTQQNNRIWSSSFFQAKRSKMIKTCVSLR